MSLLPTALPLIFLSFKFCTVPNSVRQACNPHNAVKLQLCIGLKPTLLCFFLKKKKKSILQFSPFLRSLLSLEGFTVHAFPFYFNHFFALRRLHSASYPFLKSSFQSGSCFAPVSFPALVGPFLIVLSDGSNFRAWGLETTILKDLRLFRSGSLDFFSVSQN